MQLTKNIFSVIFAFGSDMRFARWKLQGEYNITFAKQKYHADEVSISLKLLTTPAPISRKSLAISLILWYTNQ